MKTSVVLCLATLLCVSARAQVFRPETVNGAVLGGLAGAVIGNNSGDLHHNGARGAAFGAVAGALIGSAVGESRERSGTQVSYRNYSGRGYTGPRSSVSVGIGYHSGRWGSPYGYRVGYGYPSYYYGYRAYPGYRPWYGYDYGYYAPVYSTYSYDYDTAQPSRAVSGALLGGLAGAIIGNNSGNGNGLQGAAIGAGAGLLLGAIADDANRRPPVENIPDYRDDSTSAPRSASVPPSNASPGAAPVSQNASVINNYYGSSSAAPMATANGLFGR